MATALLIIDVQHALCHGEHACFEAGLVVERINAVAARARQAGAVVVVVQHESARGALTPGSEGWRLAAGLDLRPGDTLLRKTTPDAFHGTTLHEQLQQRRVTRLVVCGMQSDFCVDTTTRRALALGYAVTLVADGHTTLDNGVLDAARIRAHHNETLTHIGSFGPPCTAQPAAQVRFDDGARGLRDA